MDWQMEIHEKLLLRLIPIVFFSGCVTMSQMQNGVNEVDMLWGKINEKILISKGSRSYSISNTKSWKIATQTIKQLGFTVTEEHPYSEIIAKASTPTPFTVDEYNDIRKIEEPMMQSMAANHVGKFYSNFFRLDSEGNFYAIVSIKVLSKDHETSRIQLTFKIEPKEEIKPKDFVYGQNPPPEALKKALDKWWIAFENNLAK